LSCLHSVYAQHKWFFDSTHRTICPCAAFFQDLALDIQGWHAQGDGILLFADFNGDIRKPEIISFATSCGLLECVLSQHPMLLPPATFRCGACFGHSPIDGVWASNDVIVQAASILPVAISPGDHRAFLIDLNLNGTIGQPRFRVAHPPARRLTCTLPSVEAKYIDNLSAFCAWYHLSHHLDDLFWLAQLPDLDHSLFQMEMEKFDQIKAEGMRFAEKQFRRFHMGLVQFSPQLNYWHLSKLWHLVIRCHLGYRVHAETIRKMGHKLNVFDPLSLSLSAAQDCFRTASTRYQAAKPNHEILHQSFLFGSLQDPTLDDAHYWAIQELVCLEKV